MVSRHVSQLNALTRMRGRSQAATLDTGTHMTIRPCYMYHICLREYRCHTRPGHNTRQRRHAERHRGDRVEQIQLRRVLPRGAGQYTYTYTYEYTYTRVTIPPKSACHTIQHVTHVKMPPKSVCLEQGMPRDAGEKAFLQARRA